MRCAHAVAVAAMGDQILRLCHAELMSLYEEYVRDECDKRERVVHAAEHEQIDLFVADSPTLLASGADHGEKV